MKPALTAEEWEIFLREKSFVCDGWVCASEDSFGLSLHGEAAVVLHGQPFGFTREDVDMLRALEPLMEPKEALGLVRDLADRIESLLPQEDVDD